MKYFLILLPTLVLANYKVEVENFKTGRKYGAIFETIEELQEWRQKQIKENSWGKPERVKRLREGEDESKCSKVETVELEESDLLDRGLQLIGLKEGRVIKKCTLPKEYEITVIDISQEIQEEKTRKRNIKNALKEWRDGKDLNLKQLNELLRKVLRTEFN